jgi:hypothetical protein
MRVHRWPFTQLCSLACLLAWTVHPALAQSVPTLNFTATLGGSGFDSVYAMTVDSAGSIYVAGETDSSAFGSTFRRPSRDAFVAKLDTGGSPLYVVYFGGSGADSAHAIAVDSAGNVYVAGVTSSLDFPTTLGVVGAGNAGLADAFAVKLNASGSVLYSTLLGSTGDDQALGKLCLSSSAKVAMAISGCYESSAIGQKLTYPRCT